MFSRSRLFIKKKVFLPLVALSKKNRKSSIHRTGKNEKCHWAIVSNPFRTSHVIFWLFNKSQKLVLNRARVIQKNTIHVSDNYHTSLGCMYRYVASKLYIDNCLLTVGVNSVWDWGGGLSSGSYRALVRFFCRYYKPLEQNM